MLLCLTMGGPAATAAAAFRREEWLGAGCVGSPSFPAGCDWVAFRFRACGTEWFGLAEKVDVPGIADEDEFEALQLFPFAEGFLAAGAGLWREAMSGGLPDDKSVEEGSAGLGCSNSISTSSA